MKKRVYNFFISIISDILLTTVNVDIIKGEIDTISGKRALSTEVKITMRKKSADQINIGDTIVVSNQTGNYRINDKFESTLDFYTTLMATKVE